MATLSPLVVSLFLLLSTTISAYSAVFNIPPGNVAALIAAINAANANGEENTINLAAGTYSLTMSVSNADGPNGLPSITGVLTISGAGSDNTIIERATGSPFFRLMHVASTGRLTLEGLRLQRGNPDTGVNSIGGGAIFNRGGLTLSHAVLTNNSTLFGAGGGIRNENGTVSISASAIIGNENEAIRSQGKLSITDSLINSNSGIFAGGVFSVGDLVITRSTLANNRASGLASAGGAIATFKGTVTVTDSAIINNFSRGNLSGAISNLGNPMTLVNCTIANNVTTIVADEGAIAAGGVFAEGGLTLINDTIVGNELDVQPEAGAVNARVAEELPIHSRLCSC